MHQFGRAAANGVGVLVERLEDGVERWWPEFRGRWGLKVDGGYPGVTNREKSLRGGSPLE